MSQTSLASPAAAPHAEHAGMRHLWWLFVALGLVSIFLGFVAIGSPYIALASVIVFGVLLLVAGITEVIHAVIVRNWRGFALHLLAAALYLFVGLFMLEDPVRAADVLILLLAAGFFVGGLLRILFSLVVRFPAWSWVLLHGAIDLILGVLIFRWRSERPDSILQILGLFIGIDLIFHGWSWVFLGLTVRTYAVAQPD
jgi:uncharacterized membrane protein HdeD (DUF308 family)